MSPPRDRTSPDGAGPAPNTLAVGALGVAPSLEQPADIADAYCVYLHTPYDRTYRRLFLSLHSATRAVGRARKRGLQAELLLCRLTAVQAVDLDGGES
jgi:hypothetical protein